MSQADTGFCVVRYRRLTDIDTGITTFEPLEPPDMAGLLVAVSRPAPEDEILWATPQPPEPDPEPA